MVATTTTSGGDFESGGGGGRMVTSEGTSLLRDIRITNDEDYENAAAAAASANKKKTFFKVAIAVSAMAVIYLVSGMAGVSSGSSSSASMTVSEEQDWASAVDMEGKSKKKEKRKSHGHDHHEQDSEKANVCDDGGYSKRTLKKSYELPFASLFNDNKGQKKYEASDIVVVDEYAYAVCDNSWAISKFNRKLEPFLETNVQVGDPSREKDSDSGYEGLFYDDGSFYVVRESVSSRDKTYHAIIEQISIADGSDDYDISETCGCEFEFEGDSKGFEGAIGIRDLNNQLVVLGLCEGNYCSQTRKNEKGNGKLVAMRREMLPGDGPTLGCQWSTIRTIDIPSSANFKDYSAITMRPDSGRVAITSQEESQVWIGMLTDGKDATADGQRLWDVNNMEFVSDQSPDSNNKIFDFPKNDHCQTIYCNIEGVHWLNDEMLIAVSDKMKGKGKQDFRCFDKDQSVHVFVLP